MEIAPRSKSREVHFSYSPVEAELAEINVVQLPASLPQWVVHLLPLGNRLLLKKMPQAGMREHGAAGLKYAHMAVIISIVADITIFVIARLFTTCNQDGIPVYPMWIWAVHMLLFIPILLYLEVMVLGHTLVPYLRICVPKFPVVGVVVRFEIWLAVRACMSILNHIKSVNESFFAVVAMKEAECGDFINTIWNRTLADSLLVSIPGVRHLVHCKFHVVIFCCWILTFVHELWVFPETMQTWCGDGKKVASEPYDGLDAEYPPKDSSTDFHNLLGSKTTTGDALHTAADGAHMATLQIQCLKYPMAREQEERGKLFEIAKRHSNDVASESGVPHGEEQFLLSTYPMREKEKKERQPLQIQCNARISEKTLDIYTKSLMYNRHLLVRTWMRVLLNGVLESGLQLNLKVTLFAIAIHKIRANARADTWSNIYQAVAFVLTSLLTVATLLDDGFKTCHFWWKRRAEWNMNIDTGCKYLRVGNFMLDPSVLGKDKQHQHVMHFVLVLLSLCILFAFFAYAMCKLAAAFLCETAMWNITGCVANI